RNGRGRVEKPPGDSRRGGDAVANARQRRVRAIADRDGHLVVDLLRLISAPLAAPSVAPANNLLRRPRSAPLAAPIRQRNRMVITSIKPNITREQAVAKFRGGLSQLRHGRLRMAADFYVPYRFFQMTLDNGRRKTGAILAADAVTGNFDLIEFDQLPGDVER